MMNSLSHEARAMNAVERLEAAIEKLETLKAKSTPGPWEQYQYDWRMIIAGLPADDEADVLFDRATAKPTDMHLIVTMHRTIDAQLAILRDAVEFGATFGYGTSGARSAQIDHWFDLADAILGES